MKNYWAEYIAYIKDNPDHKWFKRKLYGWGWTPATWHGWLVTVIAAFFIFMNIARVNLGVLVHDGWEALHVLVPTLLTIKILFAICIWKGEKPKWQWGSSVRGTDENLQR